MAVAGLDIVIATVVLLSAVIGLVRGLMKEVLSLAAWVLAFVVAMYFSPFVALNLPPSWGAESVRMVIAFACLFIASLIIAGIVQWLIAKLVETTGLTGTDRFLGFLFGSARGLLVAIVLLMILREIGSDTQWWQASVLQEQLLAFEGDVRNLLQQAKDLARDVPTPGSQASPSRGGIFCNSTQSGVKHNMCGIVGLVSKGPVNQAIYDALTVLQHRGQDAAGMVTSDGNKLHLRKANGLVRDVFRQEHMQLLNGNIGIGHVRYPTAGSSSSAEAQPMYVNSPYGITLAHNGNLTNADQLKADLFAEDLRHINTTSDSEVLLNVLAHELQQQRALDPSPEEIFNAVAGVHKRCRGAYAAVAMIIGCGVLGFRDPYGIRPLVYGERETDQGKEYMLASESVALDLQGYTLLGSVAPGEAIFISSDGNIYRKVCAEKTQLVPCIFEHVYLARPDSIMDDISVYKSRLRMGEHLAARILERYSQHTHDIDVVIPIPDTGRTAALPLAHQLDVKFREGFVKNRYIGRTFIMPGQQERKKSVRQKLNVIELEFRDKNVLLVDDSIVRGTTTQQIIQMARDAGARKVYMASAAPALRYQNVYGIDMPARQEFVANERTDEEVAEIIGADWLVYQDINDLKNSAREGNPRVDDFECSAFDGHYVTGDIDADYLSQLSLTRSDLNKQRSDAQLNPDATILELHNHG